MRPSLAGLVPLLVLASCDCDDGEPAEPDANVPDAARATDAEVGRDAAEDAALDAGVDAGEPARPRIAWVTVGGDSRLAVIELAVDGTLAEHEEMSLTLPGNPSAMAYGRASRRLYVAMGGDSIATLALDDEGRPSLLGQTDGTGSAVYLALAYDETVLVSGYFGDDELATHDVSGAPPHEETARIPTADEPHSTLVGPTGDLVYVPHRGGDTIRWFGLAADGALSLRDELEAERGVGPRHISLSPDGAFAYVVNEQGDSVSSHHVSADGALERFQTLSTLPEGVNGSDNSCADVHVTPDGRFLYASNRGDDSIARFTVLPDGSLAFEGTVPTEATPREFDPSPDGRFLLVAGQDSGHVASYAVEADGALTSVDRLELGPDLRWIAID